MSELAWERVAAEFERDGSLRDLNVYGVTLADWQRVLDGLRAAPWPLLFQIDSVPAELPHRVEEIFATKPRAAPSLGVQVGSLRFNSFFFSDDVIDFDAAPGEVRDQVALDTFIGFMRWLGTTVEQPVGVSWEGMADKPFMRYEPAADQVRYFPLRGFPAA